MTKMLSKTYPLEGKVDNITFIPVEVKHIPRLMLSWQEHFPLEIYSLGSGATKELAIEYVSHAIEEGLKAASKLYKAVYVTTRGEILTERRTVSGRLQYAAFCIISVTLVDDKDNIHFVENMGEFTPMIRKTGGELTQLNKGIK